MSINLENSEHILESYIQLCKIILNEFKYEPSTNGLQAQIKQKKVLYKKILEKISDRYNILTDTQNVGTYNRRSLDVFPGPSINNPTEIPMKYIFSHMTEYNWYEMLVLSTLYQMDNFIDPKIVTECISYIIANLYIKDLEPKEIIGRFAYLSEDGESVLKKDVKDLLNHTDESIN